MDGSIIPDDEIVNHVRMSRCFFYVADVLRQVIENGGVAPKKTKEEPFYLPISRRERYAFCETPIPISEVTKRINALIEKETMESLPYSAIRDWLLSIGMLEQALDGNGKQTKRPTKQGENMGIVLEARTGAQGPYFVTVYHLTAQHFIIDNLDAIVAYRASKKENQGQPWTQEQEQCLVDLFQKGVPIKEIAVTLKRNSGAVRARLEKLNLYKL